MKILIRLFDIFVSSLLIIILSPVALLIALKIKKDISSDVFFIQRRPGFKGCIFEIIKFKTMSDAVDDNGVLLSDDKRSTSFGIFLRSTSLDELPELWNVLRGEMSLVGPRPLLEKYLLLYNDFQKRRHDIKPGITGWAQVNGRNAISWSEKFELDIWYVENQSFWLNVKILFLTVKSVFKREGITHQEHINMPEFKGNEDGSTIK
jgi:lipopolysaccharide/colanic/teichoic acid biosynthesis glycosyltransferase